MSSSARVITGSLRGPPSASSWPPSFRCLHCCLNKLHALASTLSNACAFPPVFWTLVEVLYLGDSRAPGRTTPPSDLWDERLQFSQGSNVGSGVQCALHPLHQLCCVGGILELLFHSFQQVSDQQAGDLDDLFWGWGIVWILCPFALQGGRRRRGRWALRGIPTCPITTLHQNTAGGGLLLPCRFSVDLFRSIEIQQVILD